MEVVSRSRQDKSMASTTMSSPLSTIPRINHFEFSIYTRVCVSVCERERGGMDATPQCLWTIYPPRQSTCPLLMTFSSYPGSVYSGDDFYTMSSGVPFVMNREYRLFSLRGHQNKMSKKRFTDFQKGQNLVIIINTNWRFWDDFFPVQGNSWEFCGNSEELEKLRKTGRNKYAFGEVLCPRRPPMVAETARLSDFTVTTHIIFFLFPRWIGWYTQCPFDFVFFLFKSDREKSMPRRLWSTREMSWRTD